MRVSVAGRTISVDGATWFADFSRNPPIYHAWSPNAKTRCGLTLAETIGDGERRTIRFLLTGLPVRLGIRIGRPCTRCWPELRNQTSLFKRSRSTRDESKQEVLDGS